MKNLRLQNLIDTYSSCSILVLHHRHWYHWYFDSGLSSHLWVTPDETSPPRSSASTASNKSSTCDWNDWVPWVYHGPNCWRTWWGTWSLGRNAEPTEVLYDGKLPVQIWKIWTIDFCEPSLSIFSEKASSLQFHIRFDHGLCLSMWSAKMTGDDNCQKQGTVWET